MADFSSDTDDSAVEELISQTRDLCVLEQLAAINCSGFSDSPLPADLDSRFRRLKSFPVTKPLYSSSDDPGRRRPEQFRPDAMQPMAIHRNGAELEEEKNGTSPAFGDGKGRLKQMGLSSISSPLESLNWDHIDEEKTDLNGTGDSGKVDIEKETSDSFQTPSDSSNSCMGDDIVSPPELNMEEKSHSKSKSKSKLRSVSSSLGSFKSWMNSPSPLKKIGCFWRSHKKDSPKRKTKGNRVEGTSFDWSQHDDILSDLGILSKKEQEKLLKKAMKEEEKIIQEAEKIVMMAKQASARMTMHRMEDEESDDGISKYI
ncbi:hypothetical protein SAY86_023835 [Trapa natans]|uniref:Uncharacterized protein n=1 Tax=Trapa natans TaxID=22666 RepID=A0AAN7R9P3_TRANT|nr:hypothetical protein SAY86_023835 [Trapa natans]